MSLTALRLRLTAFSKLRPENHIDPTALKSRLHMLTSNDHCDWNRRIAGSAQLPPLAHPKNVEAGPNEHSS